MRTHTKNYIFRDSIKQTDNMWDQTSILETLKNQTNLENKKKTKKKNTKTQKHKNTKTQKQKQKTKKKPKKKKKKRNKQLN